MNYHHHISGCVSGLLVLSAAVTCQAQISITSIGSGVYTQNFDSLASSGSGNVWTDNVTLVGWYAAGVPGGTYSALSSTDINTPADLYSFGTGTDRALGALNGRGGAPISYGLQLVNDTGATLTTFTVTLDAAIFETPGGNDNTTATYGFGLTSLTDASGTWISAPSLGVDKFTAGTTMTFTPDSPVAWAPGQSLWIRWTDVDWAGQDRSLAIDNFTLDVMVPETSTYALFLGIGTLCLAACRRWIALRTQLPID